MNYIRKFSATEKAVFGVLVIIAGLSAVSMAFKVNDYFMVDVPGNDGSLSEGLVGLPHAINPVLAATDVDKDISSLVYSGLMKYRDGSFMPDLAASATTSPDGLTYTFTLKNGLRFQDGIPLTADDVAFTIQKIQDPALKSPYRADWTDVSVKVVSPAVVQFILKKPYSPFISNTTMGILPKHIWGTFTDDQFGLSQYNIDPIGSGPYKVNSISRTGDGIPDAYALSVWDGYYGTKPRIRTMTFKFYADRGKALSGLDGGSIDSLPSISSGDAARLASDSARSYTVIPAPLPRIFGVFFNQNQAPVLADKNVRAALNMVVDRQAIIRTALDGYGQAIFGPLPSDISSASSAADQLALKPAGSAGTTSEARAISAARTLLENNGWKKNPATGVYQYLKKGSKTPMILSFDIYTADTPDLKQAAEMVKDSWNALGAQVGVKFFEPSDLYQNVIRTRKYDALLFGEFVGSDQDLYAFWHSSERNAPGLNVALYANSKADSLLDSIRTTGNDSVRASKYAQFVRLISSDIPAVFLYMPDFIYTVPKSLHGVDLNGITLPSDRFSSITDWYDTTQKVWKIFAHN